MVKKKGDNPFKGYQEKRVSDNEAKIRAAIAEASKKKLRVSYPIIAKMTGIPYPTLKSRGISGKRYRSLIDPAIFNSKGGRFESESDLPDRAPKTLEEAKAHISVLSFQLHSEKRKNRELNEIIKNPSTLLEALGFKTTKPPKLSELSVARDFCHLLDRLFETCHLDFDERGNVVGKGLSHDMRASRELAKVYVAWRDKV